MGYKKVFVEVLEENNTRNFYEYYGARPIKTVQIKTGHTTLNELIYEWIDVERVLQKLS